MKKKKDIIVLLSLGILSIIGIFLSGKIFGSNMDWINQHVVFPDYFRSTFYETGNLFPQIAWNLGSGQNSYYFAYYGFLNPIILLSYLFPFIEMITYMMLSSCVLYLVSVYLFYKWIEPKYDRKITFLLSFIFLFSGPLLFHFHRQIMFVNYFPFLLLSLIVVDRNSKYCYFHLTISIFLMIMCSYYYSIGGIFVVFLYYIYKHYHDSWKQKIKIGIPIVLAALLSGILTIPTLYTILNSRSSVGENINLWSLLLPNFEFNQVLYGGYALGLTALTIPALIFSTLHKHKEKKMLGIILLVLIIFPIFRYLFNGSLYIRSKALIPFLPLFIFIIGNFLEDIFNNKLDCRKTIKVTFLVTILGFLTGYYHFAYYTDLLLTLFLIYVCSSYNKQKFFYSFIILLYFVLFIGFQFTEDFVTYHEYQEWNKYDSVIEEQIEKDTSFYRFANLIEEIDTVNKVYHPRYYKSSVYSSTYNTNYYEFHHNILNSNNDTYNHLMLVDTNNIISHRLLGTKYVLSKETLGWGYSLLEQADHYYLYKNNYALTLGYATDKIYDTNIVANYDYPYNLEALLTGIVSDNSDVFVPSYTEKLENNYLMSFGDNISISNNENYTILEVTQDSTVSVQFSEPIVHKFLFIEIDGLEENSCDTELSIEINNIKNRLTCKEWNYPNKNHNFHFLVNEDRIATLSIKISKGTYKISNVNLYTMDKNIFDEQFDLMENVTVDGDAISGSIEVTNDGYMMLSIPYDEGFTVRVDGNVIDYKLVNNGFIGFEIEKGQHQIEVCYETPGFKIGVIVSGIGITLLIIFLISLNFKKIKKLIDN